MLDFEEEEFTYKLLLLDFEVEEFVTYELLMLDFEVQKTVSSVLLDCHLVRAPSYLLQHSPATSTLQELAVSRFGTKDPS